MISRNPKKNKLRIKRAIPDRYQAFKGMDWWNPEKIQQAKVMVVGAGALGNEVLKNLALMGVGYILIVDFDNVEFYNLCKSVLFRKEDCGFNKAEVAADKIREINSSIVVQTINADIIYGVGLGVFDRMDVIIGCLDNRIARLYINKHAFQVGKTWVDGAIQDLNGQLDVFVPKKSCYECQLDDASRKIISYRLGCNDVAQRNANFGRIATTPISSSIIGAMQVQEALKIIFNNSKKSLAGERYSYWGMSNTTLQFKSPNLKENCESNCSGYKIEILSLNASAEDSLEAVLCKIKEKLKIKEVTILLNYNVILEFSSKKKNSTFSTLLPDFEFSERIFQEYGLDLDDKIIFSKTCSSLNASFPHQKESLLKLGIPRLQILNILTNKGVYFLELSNDVNFLNFR